MTEFQSMLLSPAWWLSVVVVGLIINLASAYIKGPIDVVLSRLSEAWRVRTDRVRAGREQVIESLVASADKRGEFAHFELRYRLKGLAFLVLAAMGVMYINANPGYATACGLWISLMMFMGTKDLETGANYSRLLDEAKRRQAAEQ